ncbi:MAG: response regulator [Magnetococcales bacterium]|nr:response regulator [Magnetococcales bacterium]NGZ28406.1 response regulator [Magnetococcales bacterium]
MKTGIDYPPIRVLLVDDQPIVEHLLHRMFHGQRDLILAACDNPMAAEEFAEQFKPTIILLDLVMPGIDGLGLLSRFRRRKATQGLPIILLSAQEDAEHKATAFQNGANDFLIKLPDKVEMLARLRYHARAWFNQLRAESQVQMIQRAELKYRNLFEHSRDAIFLADAVSGEVVDCNPAASDLLGVTRDFMLGKVLADLLSNRHTAFLKEMFREHVLLRRNIKSEIQIVRFDGVRIPVDVSATLFSQEGHFFSQWMLRDLTERKQLLQSLEETLTVAEMANRMRSEFLITLEREIHPPMQLLAKIASKVTGEGFRDEEAGPTLADLPQGVASLETFFGDILELARIEAGQVVIKEAPLNLPAIMDNVLAPFMEQAAVKGITLSYQVAPDLPTRLLGDSLRLRQVLFNLVKNAIQYTPSGRIDLSVRIASRPGEENMLLFSVTDTGVGIPYADQGTIFFPFYKVASHQKFRSSELGLGLAICRHMVERMGGRIGVKSQEGQGSNFYFTVKLLQWEEQPPAGETMETANNIQPPQHDARRYPIRPFQILLVDLPSEDRVMIQAFLQHIPCALEWTAHVQTSPLERCRQHTFDALLIDATTSSQESAQTLARSVRAMEKEGIIQHLMLICLACSLDHNGHNTLLAAGFDSVLSKPINRNHLLALFERLVLKPI